MEFTKDEERLILERSPLPELIGWAPLGWLAQGYALDDPPRVYHSWYHALEVLSLCMHAADVLRLSSHDRAVMALAAVFHDAVFHPGKPVGVNEARSAELMFSVTSTDDRLGPLAKRLEDGGALLHRVRDFIHMTAHHLTVGVKELANREGNFDAALRSFMDADLLSLAERRWPLVLANDNAICAEMLYCYKGSEIRERRIGFLTRMLQKERIFFSDSLVHPYGRVPDLEYQARANMQRLLEDVYGYHDRDSQRGA